MVLKELAKESQDSSLFISEPAATIVRAMMAYILTSVFPAKTFASACVCFCV
jgi:hypothetical protein